MAEKPFTDAFQSVKEGRQDIFLTAAGIFARKGYHQTTVDEIARAIGVAKGTIYYHFKNKEELYLAIIQEGINIFKERLQEAAAGAASPREKIRSIIKCHLCFYEREKDLVFLFVKELCGTDLRRETLADMLSECLGVIREVISEGVRDGTFRDVNPKITTSSLFGMVTISALHYMAYFRPIPHDPVSSAVEEILFKGIKAGCS